jgi:hypothetical protein
VLEGFLVGIIDASLLRKAMQSCSGVDTCAHQTRRAVRKPHPILAILSFDADTHAFRDSHAIYCYGDRAFATDNGNAYSSDR